MNLDLSELMALTTAAIRAPYDHVAASDYGTAMPPAVTLELIAEIKRHRQVNAEWRKPDHNISTYAHNEVSPVPVQDYQLRRIGERTLGGKEF